MVINRPRVLSGETVSPHLQKKKESCIDCHGSQECIVTRPAHTSMRQEFVTWLIAPTFFIMFGAARADTAFWLSENGLSTGSTAPGLGETPDLTKVVGAVDQEIHIWVKPDTGKSLGNFSMNLVATDADVMAFSGVEVHRDFNETNPRFEFTFDTTNQLNPDPLLQTPCPFELDVPIEMALWGFKGLSINDGPVGVGAPTDPLYDAVNESWLLATVTYDVQQEGSTDLYLQIGEVGINLVGETSAELEVVLGDTADAALNARDDRCVESTRADATITAVDQLPGDFNLSGALDGVDVDLLSEVVQAGSHLASFDLTNDNLVDEADRVHWVTVLAGTFFGDTDLDKNVGFPDFLTLSSNFGGPGGWALGDFDGDRQVAFGDFLRLSNNFGNVAAAEPVPEPHLTMLWLVLWAGWLIRMRRRRVRP